jgi:hypothetical protein
MEVEDKHGIMHLTVLDKAPEPSMYRTILRDATIDYLHNGNIVVKGSRARYDWWWNVGKEVHGTFVITDLKGISPHYIDHIEIKTSLLWFFRKETLEYVGLAEGVKAHKCFEYMKSAQYHMLTSAFVVNLKG